MKPISKARWTCEMPDIEHEEYYWYMETRDEIGMQKYVLSKYYKRHINCYKSMMSFLEKNNITNYRIKK